MVHTLTSFSPLPPSLPPHTRDHKSLQLSETKEELERALTTIQKLQQEVSLHRHTYHHARSDHQLVSGGVLFLYICSVHTAFPSLWQVFASLLIRWLTPALNINTHLAYYSTCVRIYKMQPSVACMYVYMYIHITQCAWTSYDGKGVYIISFLVGCL